MTTKHFLLICSIMAVTAMQAASYKVTNATPFTIHVRVDFLGEHIELFISPGETQSAKSLSLNKGFSNLYARDVTVGQVWGENPETGEELKIRSDMLDANGLLREFKNRIYKSSGQAFYHNFLLIVTPEKNEQGQWVPSFKLGREKKTIPVRSWSFQMWGDPDWHAQGGYDWKFQKVPVTKNKDTFVYARVAPFVLGKPVAFMKGVDEQVVQDGGSRKIGREVAPREVFKHEYMKLFQTQFVF